MTLIRDFIEQTAKVQYNVTRYGKRLLAAMQLKYTVACKTVKALAFHGLVDQTTMGCLFYEARRLSKITKWLIREGTLDPFYSFHVGLVTDIIRNQPPRARNP